MKEIKWDARQLTKAAIITLTVLTLIYLINSMTTSKEKNADAYLSTPNGTNQKIMTVNQSTGEINFVDKSVQALNTELVNDYATIMDAMKQLLGDDLKGEGIKSGYAKVNNRGILAKLSEGIDAITAPDSALNGRINVLNCGSTTCTADDEPKYRHNTAVDGAIVHYGHRIDLDAATRRGGINYTYRLGDDRCNDDFDSGGDEKARWCRTDPNDNHSRINLTISKG